MSEGGLTLAQVVQQLDGYDDELMIWARARTDLADLTPDTEAVVAPQLEDDGVWWAERGLSYVLEVKLAKAAIEVWRQWRDGVEPSAAQRCAAVIHSAVNDAYLEIDTDEPGDGLQGGGSGAREHPPADWAAGELEQALVDVGAPFPAQTEPAVLVRPGDGAFNHPPPAAQPRAVPNTATGDLWPDATGAQEPPIAVVVIAAVSDLCQRPATGPTDPAPDRRDRIQQWQKLGDVVAVAPRHRHCEGAPAGVGQDVVLGAGPAPVDRAGTGRRPPLSARTWEESATARPRSSRPAARRSASSSACSWSHTPAACQSRSRRQQVIPEP